MYIFGMTPVNALFGSSVKYPAMGADHLLPPERKPVIYRGAIPNTDVLSLTVILTATHPNPYPNTKGKCYYQSAPDCCKSLVPVWAHGRHAGRRGHWQRSAWKPQSTGIHRSQPESTTKPPKSTAWKPQSTGIHRNPPESTTKPPKSTAWKPQSTSIQQHE